MTPARLIVAGAASALLFAYGVLAFVLPAGPVPDSAFIISVSGLLTVGPMVLVAGLARKHRRLAIAGWTAAFLGSIIPGSLMLFALLVVFAALPAVVSVPHLENPSPRKWRTPKPDISPSGQLAQQGDAGRGVTGITAFKGPGGMG